MNEMVNGRICDASTGAVPATCKVESQAAY
jgi:hypothetical protein